MKGRPQKPDHLKVLQGTYRKQRANPNEPRPTEGVPCCPDWLDVEAKKVWKKTTAALANTGLLTKADFPTLTQFCDLYSKYILATQEFNKDPRMIIDGTPNPLLRIIRQYAAVVRPLIAALGLSPLDRPKLQVPGMKAKPNGFEAFK